MVKIASSMLRLEMFCQVAIATFCYVNQQELYHKIFRLLDLGENFGIRAEVKNKLEKNLKGPISS